MMGGQARGPKLTADADGVYIKCCKKQFTYDLDLNLKGVQEVAGGGCGGGSCKGMASQDRALTGGMASLTMGPRWHASGKLPVQVTVLDAAMKPDADATVCAFIYAKGQPESGKKIEMAAAGAGVFEGVTVVAEPGARELAVRVTRPGMEDELVYYMLGAK